MITGLDGGASALPIQKKSSPRSHAEMRFQPFHTRLRSTEYLQLKILRCLISRRSCAHRRGSEREEETIITHFEIDGGVMFQPVSMHHHLTRDSVWGKVSLTLILTVVFVVNLSWCSGWLCVEAEGDG